MVTAIRAIFIMNDCPTDIFLPGKNNMITVRGANATLQAAPAKGSDGGRIRWMIKPGAAGAAVETGSGIIPRQPVSGTARG